MENVRLTSRKPETRHDGTDPADSLSRAPKLIMECHEEDPEGLQSSHHQDIDLQSHTL